MGKKKGIRKQVFHVLLVINIFFILTMVLFIGFYNQRVIIDDFNKSMTVSSKNLSSIMSEWMDNRLRELELYTSLNPIEDLGDSDSILKLENMNYDGIKSFDYFNIAAKNGDIIATNTESFINVSKEDYFKSVMKGEKVITFEEVNIDKANVVFSVPIYDKDDNVIGMLSGIMDHSRISDLILDFSIQEDIDILISNNNGEIIYSNKFEDQLSHKKLQEKYIDTKNFLGKDNISYLDKYENDNNIYYFSKIEVTKNWMVVYVVQKSYLYESLFENLIIVAAMALLLIFISLIFSIYISNKISKPLVDLKNVFLQASTGDLYVRADECFADEIGEANKGFNIMMDKIINMTYKDSLTGRTNYSFFVENLEKEVLRSSSKSEEDKFAVMVIGVDSFKMINDSYGFDIGNEVLKQITVLSSSVSKDIYEISRLGGDEFGIIIKSVDPELDGYRFIKRLNKMLKEGLEIDNNKIYVSVSAGISLYPDNGESASDLMKGAYIALNRGKEKAKGDMKVYSEELEEELLEQVEISMLIMDGLKNNEFFLNYQPIIDVESDKITSVEVLVRWESKTKGFIAPSKFIPIAEASGQIIPLGKYILFEACKGIKRIQQEIDESIGASINISAIQLLDSNFVKNLEEAIKEYDVRPETIILEITERVLMEDSEKLSILIKRIKRIGFKIALDDFGTGYSSLSYLSHYPVDILKIDQSFVHKLENDNNTNKTLIETMIAISHKMQIRVIAEGVETSNQLKILTELGCESIQGYYISRPKVLDDFISYLKDRK